MKKHTNCLLLLLLPCFFFSCVSQNNIEKRARYIFNQVFELRNAEYCFYNDKKFEDCVDLTAFSEDFRSVILEAHEFEADEFKRGELDGVGYEFFTYWIFGQEADEECFGLQQIIVRDLDEEEGKALVDAVFYNYEPTQFEMKLIRENNKWVIDDFDDNKQELQKALWACKPQKKSKTNGSNNRNSTGNVKYRNSDNYDNISQSVNFRHESDVWVYLIGREFKCGEMTMTFSGSSEMYVNGRCITGAMRATDFNSYEAIIVGSSPYANGKVALRVNAQDGTIYNIDEPSEVFHVKRY